MRLNVRVCTAIVALGLGVATSVGAQPPRGVLIGGQTKVPGVLDPAERFAAADTNKDGKVDKAEFQVSLIPDAKPYVDAIWKNRDTNKDGWLTQEELTTNGPPLPRPGPGGVTGTAPPPSPAAGQ